MNLDCEFDIVVFGTALLDALVKACVDSVLPFAEFLALHSRAEL